MKPINLAMILVFLLVVGFGAYKLLSQTQEAEVEETYPYEEERQTPVEEVKEEYLESEVEKCPEVYKVFPDRIGYFFYVEWPRAGKCTDFDEGVEFNIKEPDSKKGQPALSNIENSRSGIWVIHCSGSYEKGDGHYTNTLSLQVKQYVNPEDIDKLFQDQDVKWEEMNTRRQEVYGKEVALAESEMIYDWLGDKVRMHNDFAGRKIRTAQIVYKNFVINMGVDTEKEMPLDEFKGLVEEAYQNFVTYCATKD